MRGKVIFAIILIGQILLAAVSQCDGFDNKITHPDITSSAIVSSQLPHISKKLGFANGIDTIINYYKEEGGYLIQSSASILDLLRGGSYAEDVPNCRAANHFHNPLLPWYASQMRDFPDPIYLYCKNKYPNYIPYFSNITWATGFVIAGSPAKQTTNNKWDWDRTRSAYYLALTSTVKQDRDNYFAATFYGLGNIMHLLQDMAVPAHVRSDFSGHLEFSLREVDMIEGFEYYVQKNRRHIKQSTAINITNSSYTNYWDSNLYAGTNPEITAYQGGLAEYSNANFLSRSTMLTDIYPTTDVHYFPYPKDSSTELFEEITANGGKKYYLKKTGDGETVNHLAVASRFYKFSSSLPATRKILKLDSKCFEDYANLLLPKAVGYSAGLLNYFFRGDFEILPDDEAGSGYVIVNKSAEDMDGTFSLWYDSTAGDRKFVTSWNLNIPKTDGAKNYKSSSITFNKPSDNKEKNKYLLVFRGKMGSEEDAVMGKKVEIKGQPYLFLAVPYNKIAFELKTSNGQYQLISNTSLIIPIESSSGSYNLTIQSSPDDTNHFLTYLYEEWDSYNRRFVLSYKPEVKSYGLRLPFDNNRVYGTTTIITPPDSNRRHLPYLRDYFYEKLNESDGEYQLNAFGRHNFTLNNSGTLISFHDSVWRHTSPSFGCSFNYIYRYILPYTGKYIDGQIVATDQAGRGYSYFTADQGWVTCPGPNINHEIIAALGNNKTIVIRNERNMEDPLFGREIYKTHTANFYNSGNSYSGKFNVLQSTALKKNNKKSDLMIGNEIIDSIEGFAEYIDDKEYYIPQDSWGSIVYDVTRTGTGPQGCGGTPSVFTCPQSYDIRKTGNYNIIVNDYDNLNGDDYFIVLYQKQSTVTEYNATHEFIYNINYCQPNSNTSQINYLSKVNSIEKAEQLMLSYKIPSKGIVKTLLNETKAQGSDSNPILTTGFSTQLNKDLMVYTYIQKTLQGNDYVFAKRIIGLINISNPSLPVGYRQEFEITNETFPVTNFYFSQLAAIGIHIED